MCERRGVNPFDLSGKAALVTGGNSGLGRDIVLAMQRAGAKCYSVSRTGALRDEGRPFADSEGALLDLTRSNAATTALDLAERQVGPIDILVNCAGISEMARAEQADMALFSQLLAINLVAVQALSAEFVRRCKARKAGGSIINVGSILSASPMRGASAYAASKAALDQMSRVQALEWGRHGIRVNVIAPGWYPTPMTGDLLNGPTGAILRQKNPLGRLGQSGDLDGAVLLLASDAGRYITGAIIPVDGGQQLAG